MGTGLSGTAGGDFNGFRAAFRGERDAELLVVGRAAVLALVEAADLQGVLEFVNPGFIAGEWANVADALAATFLKALGRNDFAVAANGGAPARVVPEGDFGGDVLGAGVFVVAAGNALHANDGKKQEERAFHVIPPKMVLLVDAEYPVGAGKSHVAIAIQDVALRVESFVRNSDEEVKAAAKAEYPVIWLAPSRTPDQ